MNNTKLLENLQNAAKKYLSLGLSVIPLREGKAPAIPWKKYQKTRMTKEEVEKYFSLPTAKGIGIICGDVSGGLEVIDVDCKNDNTGLLMQELDVLKREVLPEICHKLVEAYTPNEGYHIYFKTKGKAITGNQKLSARNTTVKEKEKHPHQKVKVLIETRGEGGYVAAYPTEGYSFIQGSPSSIPIITQGQRSVLLYFCLSNNKTYKKEKAKKITKTSPTHSSSGLSPFADYNKRGDVVQLLESKGWEVVTRIGNRVHLKRPGETTSPWSGNWHKKLRMLYIFSTSTEFEPEKAYNASSVFKILKCRGDNKLTYRKLLQLGFGEPYKGGQIKSYPKKRN